MGSAQAGRLGREDRRLGEKVHDYLEIEYSVPESRFNHWPPALKAQFADAHTVKPGKVSFRLALLPEGGAE